MSTRTVYDSDGVQVGTVDIAAGSTNTGAVHAFACSVHRLMQQWRQGTVGCKTRGEVSLSNRKPFKQKGTGRARAGTFRSPLWRKGGIIFGPQPRVRTCSIARRQKRLALASVFETLAASDSFYVVKASFASPSTKQAADILKSLQIAHKRVVLFLSPEQDEAARSFSNIATVSVLFIDQLNAYHMVRGECWLVLEEDVASLNAMVAKWS